MGTGSSQEGHGSELYERERELRAIGFALAGARAGAGGVVLLEGVAGIGKTSLLAAAGGLARECRMEVLTARGAPLERSLSFGLARQLFERRLAGGDRERLLAGPAASAAAALGEAQAPAGGPDEELELLHSLYWLAATLGDARPLLLAVDDLHWADTPSLRFLAYLGQRVDELAVAVVAARRPAEPGASRELIGELTAAAARGPLTLDPLSDAAVAAIVRHRHPDADETFCAACARVTAGNPFLLGDLLDGVADEGLPPVAATAERLDDLDGSSLARRTLVRLDRLGAGAAELARAVALLGDDAELRHAAALAELELGPAAAAAGTLATAGLLRTGEPLSFVHPLLESAIRDSVPAAEHAAAHARAAQRLSAEGAPAQRVAAHLLRATRAGDAEAVATLMAAADDALGARAFDSAVSYLRRALEEPPPPSARAQVMVALGEAEALAGEPGAAERLSSALDELSDPRERAEAHYRLGWTFYKLGRPRDAADAFRRGFEDYGRDDDDFAAELRTAAFGVGSLIGGADTAELERALPPRVGAAPAGSVAEREVLTQLAVAQVLRCESAAAGAGFARRALGAGTMLAASGVSLTFSMAVGCLLWCDAIDDAEQELEAGVAYAIEHETPVTAAYVRFGRAWPRLWRGQAAEAAEDLQQTWEVWRGGWSVTLPSAGYWLTRAMIELGELDAARALELPPSRRGADEPELLYWRNGRALLDLAERNPEAAWTTLSQLLDDAARTPVVHNPAALNWRSTAALTLTALGRQEEALPYAREEVELARRFGAPRPLGEALRAQGLVEGGERGIELLTEAVEVLERSAAALEHGRALVDLGASVRRTGHPVEAREHLRGALDLLSRTSATVLRDRARDELAAAGGRPRREALAGVESLTPSERRVAELAAAGCSNPEIARELFVARKTVESHLGGVFRKLEISSREELRDVLAASGSTAT